MKKEQMKEQEVQIVLVGLNSLDTIATVAEHLNALLSAERISSRQTIGDMIPPEVRRALVAADKNSETIGLVKQLRKQFGNKLLSNAIGVSERTVRGWIAGEKFPSQANSETIQSFAKCANISAN